MFFPFIRGVQSLRCAVGDTSRGTLALTGFSGVSVSAVRVAVNTCFCTTALFGSLAFKKLLKICQLAILWPLTLVLMLEI